MMKPLRALGLMSGTSMDGVDAAIVITDGVEDITYGPARALAYDEETRQILRDARGWGEASLAEARVTHVHSPACVGRFDPAPELIGFHGQTLAHDPQNARTRQIGDGAALANAWGAPTVWDFRSGDMRAGGQGAPLAPLFHFHALRANGQGGTVAIVNIGGVGNVTWADLSHDDPTHPDALLSFDTGPGGALIDDLMRRQFGQPYDKDGALAARGEADEAMIRDILALDFFAMAPPKSLDRDAFSGIETRIAGLQPPDALATLTQLTASSIIAAADHFPHPPDRWLITGGGRKNATLMQMMQARSNTSVAAIEAVGMDGDMLEAQAFAWLAVRVLRGLPTSVPRTTGCKTPCCGGIISWPDLPDGRPLI